MRSLFLISMDDRSDRVLNRIGPLLSGLKYGLRTRTSDQGTWETISSSKDIEMDQDLREMEGMKEVEPLFRSLGAGRGSRIMMSNAHQVSDEDVMILDSLLEEVGSGDMVIILMDMDRYLGHNPGGYFSSGAISNGAFSLGMIQRTAGFTDFKQIESLNREILAMTGSFNGLIGIPPRVTREGRHMDIAHLIRHLSDMAFTPGIINLDHADLMLTSKGGSILVMTWGAARPGGNRAATSVKDALTKHLCDVDLRSVRKALVNVVGSGDLTLEDSLVAAEVLRKRVKPNSNIIWGVSLVEGMEEEMEVLLILATTPMELLLHWYSRG